jgi:hypothetical protein
LRVVNDRIQWIYEACHVTPAMVEEQEIPHVLPMVSHRFLVVDGCESNPVLSMYGDDIIPYSRDLMQFLVDDIFRAGVQDSQLPPDLRVKFWLELR